MEPLRLANPPEAATRPGAGSSRARVTPAVRDLVKRYGLALALASLALWARVELPLRPGTAIYQLAVGAVVLSAWYGGRGPGVLALLVCAVGTLYWLIPPADSIDLPPDYAIGFCLFVVLCLLLAEFSAGRRRALQELRASEERFHALVRFSFDVWYWETDAEHRFTRQVLSQESSGAPQFPRAQIGKTRWEHPSIEPDEAGWRQHRATLDARLPFRNFERLIPTADGGPRYHSISGIPVFDQAGRFVGYRGVGRDITERKRAEAEHRDHVWFLESMDRINRAIQGSREAENLTSEVMRAALDIFACDRAWLVHPCDPAAPSWRAIMEHTRPEYPGAFALDADFPVDADVAAVFSAALATSEVVLLGPGRTPAVPPRAAEQFTIRSQMAMAIDAKADKPFLFGMHQCSRAREWTAGEQRLFREMGRRLGDALAGLSTLRSLRQSEAYLNEAQRLSHTASWALDMTTHRYVYTSEEFDRLFGFEAAAQSRTREAVLARMHPEDRGAWSADLDQSVREKVDTTSQYRIVLPDGAIRHIHTIRHPVLDGAGEVVQLVGTSIDITERKHAEEEHEKLRRLEAEVAHANRVNMLGELTSSIAHEVSQPLSAMVASAGACARWLAAQPPAMVEARTALDNIVADGKRARDVIARIRALAKRHAPHMDRLDVNRKIADILAFADQNLRAHDVVLETRLDGTLPPVLGDRVPLQQVLLNLIMNAVEAMSSLSDRPRELVIASLRAGNDVVVEIRDSGIGLDPSGSDRLFEAFYTTKPDGMGIGLSISRSIVEAHGGRLCASSNAPHGAVFRFSLPVAEEAAP